jgi:FixJ family two-component response regulator
MRDRMEEGMTTQGPVIAIVDDSDILRDALTCMLEAFGYRTEPYASAEDFIRSATTTRAAFLVTDVEMGGISGPDMVRDLTARGLHFPAVLMSASCNPALPRVAAELGCLAFLTKPFAPAHLLDVLARTLAPAATDLAA